MNGTQTVMRRRLTRAFWILLLAWMAVIGLLLTGFGGRDSPLTSVSEALSIVMPLLALVILLLYRRGGSLPG